MIVQPLIEQICVGPENKIIRDFSRKLHYGLNFHQESFSYHVQIPKKNFR